MTNVKLYTVKEAAKIVGVSTNTLYKYLDEDRIHAARGSAIQGRFRIPESALEEFLGVKLSEPEPIEPAVGATFTVARDVNEIKPTDPESHGQLQDLPPQPSKLPTRLARLLLIFALIAILLDLIISRTVSFPAQLSRLIFIALLILLTYQEGGFRRG